MKQVEKITGSCHCGNIAYEFSPGIDPGRLPLRICECSFCSKHGNIYTSYPDGSLHVSIAEPDKTEEYRFASKKVGFVFCRICGVMPLAKLETGDGVHAIINVNTADYDFDLSKVQSNDFSAETVQESMKRRQNNWIGNVVVDYRDKSGND